MSEVVHINFVAREIFFYVVLAGYPALLEILQHESIFDMANL